jgi:hypothetical protein
MIIKHALGPALFMALSLAVGCGGGGGGGAADPVGPEVDPDDPGLCQVDQELAETKMAKPAEGGCDEAGISEMVDGCDAGDGAGCYRLSACLAMAYMGRDDMSDERKAEVYEQLLEVTGKACDAGITEGCLMRGGTIQEEMKENPAADQEALKAQMCESYVRSCQLGGDCQSCEWSECE